MAILKAKASKGNVCEAISYILDKAKATLRATIGLNHEEDYGKQMKRTARMWGKDKPGSRQFYHLKLAFHPDDSDRNGGPLDDWSAMQIAIKLVKEFFPGYQAVLSVHNDTEHKHVHMIISAVHPTTGRKINMNDWEYRRMKDRADELSAEYGLLTIGWREAVRKKRSEETLSDLPVNYCFAEKGMHQQGKDSWKNELRNIIDAVRFDSYSFDAFRESLAREGVTLTRCTDRCITYKYKDHPAVRGDTLGGDYTMASIKNTLRHEIDWVDDPALNYEDEALYQEWGRFGGIRRNVVEAITEAMSHATWQQKQEVWAEYRQIKEEFWTAYKRRREVLREELNEAYRHRRLVKDTQWLLDPRNRKRCLAGIIYAAIIMHRYGNKEYIEGEIRNLRGKMEMLRKESIEFRNQSEAAIVNLRQREKTLEEYTQAVRRMQDMAEEMFDQPTQEMAIYWAIERDARVKEPTLDEYIEMCMKEQKDIEREEKENEKELLS